MVRVSSLLCKRGFVCFKCLGTFICPLKTQCKYINQSDWTLDDYFYTEFPTSEPRTKAFVVGQTTALVVLGIVIVLGNIACIITFARTQSLRRRSNYLLVNLAVADLLVGFADFMAIYFFNFYSTISESQDIFYDIFMFCDLLTGLASVLCLTAISVYRCLSVAAPLKHRVMGKLCYSLFVAFPWLIAMVVSVFNVIKCTVCRSTYIYFAIIIPCLGVIVIILSYTIISFSVKHSCKTSNRISTLRDRKTNVTLMIVSLASLLTWGPYQCFVSVSWLCTQCKIPSDAIFVMKLFQYLNSGLNIFIYIARMPQFKRAFLAIFYPQKCFLISTRVRDRIRVRPVAIVCVSYSNEF